jgi:hypothetical protein
MTNIGYQQQPQQPTGMSYGGPRQLTALLQTGSNPMLQSQMRVPSPNAPSPGGYGQSVSPRMQGGQWRPNMQQGGQMPPGYAMEDVTITYPGQQMHPGPQGPGGSQGQQ